MDLPGRSMRCNPLGRVAPVGLVRGGRGGRGGRHELVTVSNGTRRFLEDCPFWSGRVWLGVAELVVSAGGDVRIFEV